MTVADVPALLALQSAYYAEDAYPFHATRAAAAWRELLGHDGLGRAWLMEAGAVPVGYVVLTLGFSLEYRGRDAFLDELYVTPDWRGRGLGRRALRLVSAACAERGVAALHLEVETGKRRARALYRRWGFVDHRRVLMTRTVRHGDRARRPKPGSRRRR